MCCWSGSWRSKQRRSQDAAGEGRRRPENRRQAAAPPALRRQQETLAKEIAELAKVRPALRHQSGFQQVQLSEYLLDFIKENPQSHTRIRLNRLLLEAAYPKEIARQPWAASIRTGRCTSPRPRTRRSASTSTWRMRRSACSTTRNSPMNQGRSGRAKTCGSWRTASPWPARWPSWPSTVC